MFASVFLFCSLVCQDRSLIKCSLGTLYNPSYLCEIKIKNYLENNVVDGGGGGSSGSSYLGKTPIFYRKGEGNNQTKSTMQGEITVDIKVKWDLVSFL